MSYKTYYNLGSLVLVITLMILSILIISPFVEAEVETEAHKEELEKLTSNPELLEKEIQKDLRMHRDLYLQVSTSMNPVIKQEVKTHCETGIETIEATLYSKENLTIEEELNLRRQLQEINGMVSQSVIIQ